MRAKVILATCMAIATVATGAFIHLRLSEQSAAEPGQALAAVETSAPDAVAEQAKPAEQLVPAKPVRTVLTRSLTMPAQPSTAAEPADADALGHNDPRWGRSSQSAAKALAAEAGEKEDREIPSDAPLAFAAPEPQSQLADEQLTAAIPPNSVVPTEPVVEEPSTTDEQASAEQGRTVKIARAVNMRTRPVSGSKVIRVIPSGATVGLMSCKGWCEVTYQGSRGFIYKSFVAGSGSSGGNSAKPRVTSTYKVQPTKTAPAMRLTQRQ